MSKSLASLFVLLIIFIFPLILYLNYDRDDTMLLMNIFYYLNRSNENQVGSYAQLIITSLAFLPALVLAFFSNSRKVEEVRDFVAGERGTT